jgi:hypothetical protein
MATTGECDTLTAHCVALPWCVLQLNDLWHAKNARRRRPQEGHTQARVLTRTVE